jgi:hypothetical protein
MDERFHAGSAHFTTAEKWLARAEEEYAKSSWYPKDKATVATEIAMVHALLAQAAATAELNALSISGELVTGRDSNQTAAWSKVIGRG